jgi:hypothetical protein
LRTNYLPLTERWTDFFSSIPPGDRERYLYPVPLSPDFWRLYSEPVGEFLLAVRTLRENLDYVTGGTARGGFRGVREAGRFGLERELAHAGVRVSLSRDGRLALRHVVPSLRTLVVATAIEDRGTDELRRCACGCGRFFRADSTRRNGLKQRYYSIRHMSTAKQRRHRARGSSRPA